MTLLQIACANDPVWIAWPARNEILSKTWTHNNISGGWEFGAISNMIPMPMTPHNGLCPVQLLLVNTVWDRPPSGLQLCLHLLS